MKLFLGILIFFSTIPVWAASVSFSKTHVAIGQSVELIFSSDTPITQAPDLSVLKNDFTISGQSSGQSTTIINGTVNTMHQLTYNLFPKREGTFNIDTLTMSGEKLNPIQLIVKKNATADMGPTLTMQARVSEGPYYPGQAILYTLRMGDVSRILDGAFETPSAPDATIKQFGQDDIRTVIQQGRPIKMLERKYLIIPEQSGQMKLTPASFIGMRSIPQNRQASIGDLFERGILFDGLMGGGSQEQVFASAEPITLNILPKPSNWTGWWLASPQVTLTYTDNIPTDLKSGSTIERTITLSAKGVPAEALPVPVQPNNADLKVYPSDEVRDTFIDGDTIEGRLSVSVVLMPTNGGHITIPAITIPWFNTRTGQQETAKIEAITLTVNGPRLTHTTPQATKPQTVIQQAPKTPTPTNRPLTNSVMTAPQMWLWLIIGIISGGLIVGLAAFILGKIKTHKRKKPLPDLYPF